ncbi:hypothetical protein V5T82_08750 [Magnetovibrio sp. PR-2]|uniref:hypothetical protein n=1 Tax=Magnetovibrio sp. PR-2 TaxID=3120356 RepID=UPI002FCE5F45
MQAKTRNFFIAFAIPLALSFPFGIASYVFLLNSGELDSITEVVEHQRAEGGLYGTALHNNVYAYKLELYRAARPDVVVIGSSRVLQMRETFFEDTFINLGRTVNSAREAELLIDDMLEISKPKMVFFGIDFWWGNPNTVEALHFLNHDDRGGALTPEALFAPVKWLVDGKFDFGFFTDLVTGRLSASSANRFGLSAIRRGLGFARDGSNYYLAWVYGRTDPPYVKFKETLRWLGVANSHYRFGQEVSEERLATIKRSVDMLKVAGVEVVTFVTPVAPLIWQEMEKKGDRYSYIHGFRERLHTINDRHFDFFDAAQMGSGDCEFVDGIHGGDVNMARQVKAMSEALPSSMRARVDVKHLEQLIKRYSGNALSDDQFRLPDEREIDFLQLDCDK